MNVPSYSIPRIMKLRKKLRKWLEPWSGQVYKNEGFEELVYHLTSLLPKVGSDVVWESLRTYAGIFLTLKHIDEICCRFAGNLARLQAGIHVPPWSTLVEEEYIPVQVQDIHRYRTEVPMTKEKRAELVRLKKKIPTRGSFLAFCQVLAGYPAGQLIEKTFTDLSGFFIRTDVGFSRFAPDPTDMYSEPKKSYPMRDVTDLVGMRFLAFIDHDSCKRELCYSHLQSTPSFNKWNRIIMKKRQREGFACPLSKTLDELPCHECHFGRDRCAAACHRLTYVKKHCVKCNKEAYHDLARPGQVCVECLSNTVQKGCF